MPSPFPGMDPYLENPALWPGAHQRLITYISDELQGYIRPNYNARIGERVYIVETKRDMYPDVTIVRRPQPEPVPAGGPAVAVATPTADAPLVLTIPPVEYREPFVEIIHTASGQVITVIELLSPANKAVGKGHELYRQKQREVLKSQAHLVEIDLLSQGLPTIAIPESSFADLPPYRYLVSVSRAPDRDRFEVYTILLSQRLPRPSIPLKPSDPDVVIDLPALFNRCYDNGAYDDFVNYSQPPKVPLSAEEQGWLTENIEQAK